MAALHPLLSIEFFHILSHFPFYAVLYSIFLTILAALTIYLSSLFSNPIPLDIGENMFSFLTAIVGWLVTTRPAYALSVHDILTDYINSVFIQLEHLHVEHSLESATLLHHLALILIDEKRPPPPPDIRTKNGSKILDLIRTYQLKSMLALPRSLHGLCILLVVGFHGLLVPLILYDQNGYYCLIPNFIMAIYTSGCLEVAITIGSPYAGVTSQGSTIASEQFQFQFHRLRRMLQCVGLRKSEKTEKTEKTEKSSKRVDTIDPLERILLQLKNAPIPLSMMEVENTDEHPCKVFVADRV